jgi:superfamily II DNA or RNA helicase
MKSSRLSKIDSIALRDWQSAALDKWHANKQSGIAEVATAGGKTRFALECIFDWLQENKDGLVLIIVPTSALQDQWVLSISEVFKIAESEISCWPEKIDLNATFQVSVINSAREATEVINNQGRQVFLVADECHRYASKENSKVFAINTSATLGITATAERQYDEGLREILVPNLGKVIYEYSLLEASADNIISKFRLINIEVPLTNSEKKEYENLTRRIGFAFRQNDVEKAKKLSLIRSGVSKNAISRLPAACGIVDQHRSERVLVFHEDIESAEQIWKTLLKRGHLATIYHSGLSMDVRRDNLKMFRNGLSHVLVCIRALDEGIDVPEAEVAILAASTNSSRQRIQRIGRVVRRHEGKEEALIYTLYATDNERDLLVEEAKRLTLTAHVSWLKMGL